MIFLLQFLALLIVFLAVMMAAFVWLSDRLGLIDDDDVDLARLFEHQTVGQRTLNEIDLWGRELKDRGAMPDEEIHGRL